MKPAIKAYLQGEFGLKQAKKLLSEYKYQLDEPDLWTEIIDQVTADIGDALYIELSYDNNLKPIKE